MDLSEKLVLDRDKKIKREFKNNGIVSFAEVVDFDFDTKLYTLK